MIAAAALILDAIFGEPRWIWDRFPHPAILMGRVIDTLTRRLNHGQNKRFNGVCLLILIITLGLFIGFGGAWLGPFVEIPIAAIFLAHRSLVQHVQQVADALRLSVKSGQDAVAMIVGRDTDDMTASDATRAAIESAAENFSDGVIAPLFWLLIAGLPGLIIYKFVNTADSMIGYKNDEFAEFGWASARFDDLLNYLPARLCAFLFWVLNLRRGSWQAIAADAARHRSPNAGWPEAALARNINAALAGPRSYGGKITEFAWVNPAGQRNLTPKDIEAAIRTLWQAWIVTVSLICLTIFIC